MRQIIINLDSTVTPLGESHIVNHIISEMGKATDKWGTPSLRTNHHVTLAGSVIDVVSVGQ